MVFAMFWHFNLSFPWYLPHFGTSKVHAGFLKMSVGFYLGVHLGFLWGFMQGFIQFVIRISFGVSCRVSSKESKVSLILGSIQSFMWGLI